VLDEYDERMMVGEIYEPFDILAKYYGEDGDECHMPFNFHLLMTEWKARAVQGVIEAYEASLSADKWPNWVLGNHDRHRVASRVGLDQARNANMLLLTLRGTPTSYYGEELGMENVAIPPEFIQDPPAVNMPELADKIGRDPERTPMQWSAAPNAGFSPQGVTTWLPVSPKYETVNVAVESADPTSMLSLYRALTSLRRAEPALHVGAYQTVEAAAEDILAYKRTSPAGDDFLVVLNFGDAAHEVDLSAVAAKAQLEVSTGMQRSGTVSLASLAIGPNEGLVLRLAE
jgi:alpha-glucosidase